MPENTPATRSVITALVAALAVFTGPTLTAPPASASVIRADETKPTLSVVPAHHDGTKVRKTRYLPGPRERAYDTCVRVYGGYLTSYVDSFRQVHHVCNYSVTVYHPA